MSTTMISTPVHRTQRDRIAPSVTHQIERLEALVAQTAAQTPQACVGAVTRDPIVVRAVHSPIGFLILAASRDGLCLLSIAPQSDSALSDRALSLPVGIARDVQELSRRLARAMVPDSHAKRPGREHPGCEHPGCEHLDIAQRELAAYFAGELEDFHVTLNLPGSTFERKVWGELQRIPYGETTSYSRLAFKIGSPGAARAVGRANAANRVCIIVPCHRVINEDGSLGGFSSGLARKSQLLDLERLASRQPPLYPPAR